MSDVVIEFNNYTGNSANNNEQIQSDQSGVIDNITASHHIQVKSIIRNHHPSRKYASRKGTSESDLSGGASVMAAWQREKTTATKSLPPNTQRR